MRLDLLQRADDKQKLRQEIRLADAFANLDTPGCLHTKSLVLV